MLTEDEETDDVENISSISLPPEARTVKYPSKKKDIIESSSR
jgi:hypothetical protein